jgi:hypothetical protein
MDRSGDNSCSLIYQANFECRIVFPFYYYTRDDAADLTATYYLPFFGRTVQRGEVIMKTICFPLYSRYVLRLMLLWRRLDISGSCSTGAQC